MLHSRTAIEDGIFPRYLDRTSSSRRHSRQLRSSFDAAVWRGCGLRDGDSENGDGAGERRTTRRRVDVGANERTAGETPRASKTRRPKRTRRQDGRATDDEQPDGRGRESDVKPSRNRWQVKLTGAARCRPSLQMVDT